MAESKQTVATNRQPEEMRDVFGNTLVELGREFPEIIVLDADLNTSSKTVYFKKAFPTRFVQCGIAEQNMFGIAAGLAMQGFIPFPSTFAVFAAKRALDQIDISISYPKLNVKIPGSYVGVPTSRAGASHNSVSDIANMRALPNMRVADPGDNQDLRTLMRATVLTPGPIYFRITRYHLPDIFDASHSFAWGKGQRLIEGKDITIIGTGMMTSLCLEAAAILERQQIWAEVLHCGSIKPLDADLVAASARKTRAVVTAENAGVLGGLGSAVAEVLGERAPSILLRIGVQDQYIMSGGIAELLKHHEMTPEHIAAAALRAIEQRESLR
jgi:transketolase